MIIVVDTLRVSDAVWARIEPILPKPKEHKFGGCRPRKPDREMFDAVMFKLRTGSQWKAVQYAGFGAKSTIHDRFSEWVDAGVFELIWQIALEEYDDLVGIDWRWLSMDGSMTKAPLSGTEDAGPNPTDRGKQGAKRSLLTDANGIPLAIVVDGANVHDSKLAIETIDSIVIKRPEATMDFPQGMCLDKAYDSIGIRIELLRRYFDPHVRSRGEEKKDLSDSPGKKARRWVVERTHSWMNKFRGILIRWEKHTDNYLGMVYLACAMICFKKFA